MTICKFDSELCSCVGRTNTRLCSLTAVFGVVTFLAPPFSEC